MLPLCKCTRVSRIFPSLPTSSKDKFYARPVLLSMALLQTLQKDLSVRMLISPLFALFVALMASTTNAFVNHGSFASRSSSLFAVEEVSSCKLCSKSLRSRMRYSSIVDLSGTWMQLTNCFPSILYIVVVSYFVRSLLSSITSFPT